MGEQAVYSALWSAAQPIAEDCRRITIGYRTLSDSCGLTVNNCKANLQALVRKLAIEMVASHTSTQGTTYLVYSYPAILRRRRQAGMTHVLKTKGVVFVNPETGAPISGIPVSSLTVPEKGLPKKQVGIPVPDDSGIPVSEPPIRNEKIIEERPAEQPLPSASAFPLVAHAARTQAVVLDDDAVRRIVLRCQAFDESATEAEIAHFVSIKIAQLRNSRNIGNLTGLLIKAVPQYFSPPATELREMRAATRAREIDQADRNKELAQSILADPNASQSEREWARAVLTDTAAAS